MNWRDVFPSTPDELAFMCVCYALVALGFVLVIKAHSFIGWVWGLVA